MAGDVHFESGREVAAATTPAPGGVQPAEKAFRAARLQVLGHV